MKVGEPAIALDNSCSYCYNVARYTYVPLVFFWQCGLVVQLRFRLA